MSVRACACGCGKSLEGRRASAVYATDACRKRHNSRGKQQPVEGRAPRPSTAVKDALQRELEQLEMADVYEGRVALGIARQLDNGTVVGAAYASLSRELDRRVDALRLKAERDDDPTRVVKGRLEEKRAALAS